MMGEKRTTTKNEEKRAAVPGYHKVTAIKQEQIVSPLLHSKQKIWLLSQNPPQMNTSGSSDAPLDGNGGSELHQLDSARRKLIEGGMTLWSYLEPSIK